MPSSELCVWNGSSDTGGGQHVAKPGILGGIGMGLILGEGLAAANSAQQCHGTLSQTLKVLEILQCPNPANRTTV